MKAAIAVVLIAIAAYLYFKPAAENTKAPPASGAKVASTRQGGALTAPPSRASGPAEARSAAAVPSGGIVVAPTTSDKLADRFKTGPNAQNVWTANSGQLKTGPNAQNNWAPNSGQLKTGPNAQTDLTLKKSW